MMERQWKPRVGLGIVVAGAVVLAACGGPAKPARPAASDSALSLDKLASLTNYRSVMVAGMGGTPMTFKNSVHSVDNWQQDSPLKTRHVAGQKYTELGGQWTAGKDKAGAYEKHNLPSFAKQFYGMTQVAHASIKRGKACRQAGTDGHRWTIGADGGQVLQEQFVACVADDSGALLKLVVGAQGAVTGEKKAREVYKIVSIGDVPAFRVPLTK